MQTSFKTSAESDGDAIVHQILEAIAETEDWESVPWVGHSASREIPQSSY